MADAFDQSRGHSRMREGKSNSELEINAQGMQLAECLQEPKYVRRPNLDQSKVDSRIHEGKLNSESVGINAQGMQPAECLRDPKYSRRTRGKDIHYSIIYLYFQLEGNK